MLVALTVIAHGAALGDCIGVIEGQKHLAVITLCRREQQLHGVYRLAHIAAAGRAYPAQNSGLYLGRDGVALGKNIYRTLHGGLDLVCGDMLELEHCRAAQNCVEHAEIGVFRRGCDERYPAVLDELQQRLLLLFVEVLYLVKIQQHAARGKERVELRYYRLDIRNTRRGGV